jgi:hypothetical protein
MAIPPGRSRKEATLMRGRGSWVLAPAALVVVVLAGCGAAVTSSGGTASSTGVTANPSTSVPVAVQSSGPGAVAPGHDTPQEAADGLIQAELAGNLPLACTYFVPAQQASCRELQMSLPKGHVSVDGAIVAGDLALVEITGHVCTAGNGCQTNTNPSLGLPEGSETFKQAYDKAVGSGEFSPVPCQKVNGKWYTSDQAG